jgi:hypothetical protein
MEHEVDLPTLPTSAEQRAPSQRMPLSSRDTYSAGMRSSWESASVENLGHADEWEQHAPQALQSKSSLERGTVKGV